MVITREVHVHPSNLGILFLYIFDIFSHALTIFLYRRLKWNWSSSTTYTHTAYNIQHTIDFLISNSETHILYEVVWLRLRLPVRLFYPRGWKRIIADYDQMRCDTKSKPCICRLHRVASPPLLLMQFPRLSFHYFEPKTKPKSWS